MNWILILHNFLLILTLIACIVAVQIKDLLYAVIIVGGASVSLSIIFYLLQAPDVAITNAAVYGGIATVLYMVAISRSTREEET